MRTNKTERWSRVLGAAAIALLAACGDDTSTGGGGDAPGGGGADGGNGGDDVGGNGGEASGGGGMSSGGGGAGAGGTGAGGQGPLCDMSTAVGPTQGSVIAVSDDDDTVVAANRDSGTLSVFSVAYDGNNLPTMTKKVELAAGSEPWEVAINSCGTHAYVIDRREQLVRRIDALDQPTPTLGPTASVGSEPTGIALSPNNTLLYVANWVDGTVTVLDADDFALVDTIDLNGVLAGTGLLGPSVTAATARPGLAHPRSIAITNDGDDMDTDETIVVTEFFAQRTAPEATPDANNADINWDGLLYRIPANGDAITIQTLRPMAVTGELSGVDETGCFPNQLQSVTIRGNLAYVPSICASPRGPTAPKLLTHPVLSVVDLAAGAELAASPINLGVEMREFYTANAIGPANVQRRPLVANSVAFNSSGDLYVTANGADAVFRAVVAADGSAASVGLSATKGYIDLADATLNAEDRGQLPLGLAAAHTKPIAFVMNDITRNVTPIVITPGAEEIAGQTGNDVRVAPSSALPTADADLAYLRGKQVFNTGLDRWSLEGQAVSACQVCHFEGLSDNVTWYFARGPRQSTSLDGSFASADPTDQRIFNWTGVFDEIADFEIVARNVDGAVGGIVHTLSVPPQNSDRIAVTALGGSSKTIMETLSLLQSWADVEEFVKRVRSPRGAKGLDPVLVADGAALFTGSGGCNGCHSGGKWTISQRFYTPSDTTMLALNTTSYPIPNGFPAALLPAPVGTQMLRSAVGGDQIQCVLRHVGTFGISPAQVNVLELRADMNPAMPPAQGGAVGGLGYNVPSVLGMQVGAPYFHAGNARTLEEAMDAIFDAHSKALADGTFLTGATLEQDRAAMVAYLLSLDEATTTLPIPAAGAEGGVLCVAPPSP